MYNKIIIGIDESYTRTGISIVADGKLKSVSSIDFKGLKTKSQKRKALHDKLISTIDKIQLRASSILIIVERIRTFSKNKNDKFNISTNYIKATGALIASIVDSASEYGIEVYSVDTRSWKAQVVGSSKGNNKEGNKMLTIRHVKRLGFDVSSVNKKGNIVYNDDASDSACIALYGFIPENRQKLKLEE